MDYIEYPKVPDVVMKKGKKVLQGTLYLTTHHILFSTDNSNEQELWVFNLLKIYYLYKFKYNIIN